jgi:hypothetical protein
MKRYTFELVIEEGNDEFWEALSADPVESCKELQDVIMENISLGDNANIRLIKFEWSE